MMAQDPPVQKFALELSWEQLCAVEAAVCDRLDDVDPLQQHELRDLFTRETMRAARMRHEATDSDYADVVDG